MCAFLRAEPDITMVGKSCSKATVLMGVKVSLTGIMMFLTLPTNLAPESFARRRT